MLLAEEGQGKKTADRAVVATVAAAASLRSKLFINQPQWHLNFALVMRTIGVSVLYIFFSVCQIP